MTAFKFHTRTTAPSEAKPTLEHVDKQYGFIPNLMAGLANAPATLEAYVTMAELMERTSFSPVERTVVLLTASVANGCSYCVAGHSIKAGRAGMPRGVVDAIRNGTAINDPKLQALRTFTEKMIHHHGWVDPVDSEKFFAAGYEPRHVLEVILGLAVKTISNYANQVMETPLDAEFAGRSWHGQAAAD